MSELRERCEHWLKVWEEDASRAEGMGIRYRIQANTLRRCCKDLLVALAAPAASETCPVCESVSRSDRGKLNEEPVVRCSHPWHDSAVGETDVERANRFQADCMLARRGQVDMWPTVKFRDMVLAEFAALRAEVEAAKDAEADRLIKRAIQDTVDSCVSGAVLPTVASVREAAKVSASGRKDPINADHSH